MVSVDISVLKSLLPPTSLECFDFEHFNTYISSAFPLKLFSLIGNAYQQHTLLRNDRSFATYIDYMYSVEHCPTFDTPPVLCDIHHLETLREMMPKTVIQLFGDEETFMLSIINIAYVIDFQLKRILASDLIRELLECGDRMEYLLIVHWLKCDVNRMYFFDLDLCEAIPKKELYQEFYSNTYNKRLEEWTRDLPNVPEINEMVVRALVFISNDFKDHLEITWKCTNISAGMNFLETFEKSFALPFGHPKEPYMKELMRVLMVFYDFDLELDLCPHSSMRPSITQGESKMKDDQYLTYLLICRWWWERVKFYFSLLKFTKSLLRGSKLKEIHYIYCTSIIIQSMHTIVKTNHVEDLMEDMLSNVLF